jgi:hypothetical protein
MDQLKEKFLRVLEENFKKDPKTNLASPQEIKEEMNFFQSILHCYDCALGS